LLATSFAENLDILISEIKWSGALPRLRVPDAIQVAALPFKIGGLLALYDITGAVPELGGAATGVVSLTAGVRVDEPGRRFQFRGRRQVCLDRRDPDGGECGHTDLVKASFQM